MLFKKLSITLVIFFTFLFSTINVYATQLILGGESIGIDLEYGGVLITGTYTIDKSGTSYDPGKDGFSKGDLITHVNGVKISNIETLTGEIEKLMSLSQKITLTYIHDNKSLKHELYVQNKNNVFSTGLYVIDGITGIGTLTYYNPSNHHYGALGHIMTDSSLEITIEDIKGYIYQSDVTGIVKSETLDPGEKLAEISSIKMGNILDNNKFGIYGEYDSTQIKSTELMETKSIDEIKLGKAYFYTVINGNEVSKFEINITHLKKQNHSDIKGITFSVVDQTILNNCNGIIQGMSGSPIVQDNKIIGCVTHVDINDPHIGYGLYIDWMLENDK